MTKCAPTSVTAAALPPLHPNAKTPSRKRAAPTSKGPKKARKSRRVYNFTFEDLSPLFHVSQKQAANILAVSVITLKRNCKRINLSWPYRANKYKAGKKPVLSDKGLAFKQLPLECMKQEDDYNGDTDTESVDDDDLVKKDMGYILVSMHRANSNPPMGWTKTSMNPRWGGL